MSVIGYFERPRRDLRMPRRPDSCGIRWVGPVLSGEMSVEERLRREEMAERARRRLAITPVGEAEALDAGELLRVVGDEEGDAGGS